MHAGEGQLAVAGLDHVAGLGQDLGRRAADAGAADGRDDAEGAVLVAAVLDLQGAAGAALGHGPVDLQEAPGGGPPAGGGARCRGRRGGLVEAGGVRPEMGAHAVHEAGLVGVGDHQAGAGPTQLLGPALGVTAGGHHQRLGIAPAGPAHGAARIGVAGAGDRAGVDHVHVGFLGEGDHPPAAVVESGLEGLGLVLVQLAAEVVDGDARERGALVRFGHRRKTLWEKE